jgi:flavodoxin I
VAFVGLGDQFGYADFFLDAMGLLYGVVNKTASHIVGYWPTDGYDYSASKAEIKLKNHAGRHFVGLALDEDQQSELSSDRLNRWCLQIHAEFNLHSNFAEIND